MKKCSKCKTDKELTEFSKNKTRKDGLNSACKVCHRQLVNAHYDKKPQYYKDKALKSKQEWYAWLRTQKERPCLDCGVAYPYYVMEYDHVRGTKIADISQILKKGSGKQLKDELAKCELVCANCHRFRTFKRMGLVIRQVV